MKTVRDHIASSPATPPPPPGATHVLCWEPQPRRETCWEIVALDDRPDDAAALTYIAADASAGKLARSVSDLLGRPVTLSARFVVQDGGGDTAAGYYVIPA